MQFSSKFSRRQFLTQTGLAAGVLMSDTAFAKAEAPLRISLAQWTINPELRSGKIDNLDFAKEASKHGIHAVEYVNQFFMDKAKDKKYLGEMKKRAADHGVKSLLIMCDREGNIGDPDTAKRKQTVDNHRKWLDAAKFLGCHSIRVNAGSRGTWNEQVKLAADGLSQLTTISAKMGLNVIVENHGGLSSNADWLVQVIEKVSHRRCGTLPDFGNFRIKVGESYDSYRGMQKLLPFAKGVSVKDRVWDDKGKQHALDYNRMLKIVHASGFRGYCGIEVVGYANLIANRKKLQAAIDQVS